MWKTRLIEPFEPGRQPRSPCPKLWRPIFDPSLICRPAKASDSRPAAPLSGLNPDLRFSLPSWNKTISDPVSLSRNVRPADPLPHWGVPNEPSFLRRYATPLRPTV